jgi:hypothetical protein
MRAQFTKSKTRDVEEYKGHRLCRQTNMSFVNSGIDGKIALDDHTTFYIKKYPRFVKIKFNKEENTEAACQKIKSLCEGIKNGLSK